MVGRKSARDPVKEKQWLEIVRRWKESGLNQSQFCKQESIDDKKFYYWQRQLKQRKLIELPRPKSKKVDPVPPAFLPIQVKPVQVPAPEEARVLLEIVTPAGYLVRIP